MSTSRAASSNRSLSSSQGRGDVRGVASALNGLGDVAASQGHHDSARRYHHQSLARYRQIDDRWGIARVLADLASVDLQAGEYAEADRSLEEAVQAFRALGHQRGVARQLESLSWCASCQSRDEAAVVLASAAAAIRHRIGTRAEAGRAGKDRGNAGAGENDASAPRRTPTRGEKGSRRRSIGSSESSRRRARDRAAQAYRFGSMSRRTAEIRLAGTPSLRACSRMTSSSGAR